jgi:serine phosphatase RsbU (regulator of sigma subunit)
MVRSELKPGNRTTKQADFLLDGRPCDDMWLATQEMTEVAAAANGETNSLAEELSALRREHGKLQQAIFEAAQIQRKLCAPRELSWGEFEVAGEIFPVRHLSGDFFKVMEFDSGLGLALGDIAGKGFTAGIWLAHMTGLIHRCAIRHADPAEAIAAVNRELCQDAGEPPLTALFYARIDSASGELVYCNAGLPSPLLLRQDKTVESLGAGGPMLGALPEGMFNTGHVKMNPGDMLIAYSDGVTECRNAEDQEFETKRLLAAAGAVSGGTANLALFSTLGAVLDFADACSPGDDVTLLVVRRRMGVPDGQVRSGEKDYSTPDLARSVVRPKKSGRGKRRSRQVI